MKIKEIDRTANIAWSPPSHLPISIACGTAAQQLDATFSTNASLELYTVNLSDPGSELPVAVSVNTEHRFQKLIWASFGMDGSHPSGVLVGGTDSGNLVLYDVNKCLKEKDGLICQQSKHTGAVRALDHNPFRDSLVASGASDSDILIWDLNSPDKPMSPGARSQPADDVTCVSWNRQVQHILASGFSSRTVVWDLRKNDPIIKISTSRVRCREVCWHPDVATQLCLASEDDANPVIQLWDLRFATAPLKTLEKHQSGVLSVAWCAQDPDLLLSCGKDNRIVCWNPNSANPGGEVLCEMATSNQWNFTVQWCPRNPTMIACASFEGNIGLYSLLGGQQQVESSNKIMDSFPGMENVPTQAPIVAPQQTTVFLSKPPKWLRKPVGASFGFGGKLVSFDSSCTTVHVSQVVTQPEIVERSSSLEMTLSEGNFDIYCQHKAENSSSVQDKELWKYLQARLSNNPRDQYLKLLGLSRDDVAAKLEKTLGMRSKGKEDSLHKGMNHMSLKGGGDASDVFDSIAESTPVIEEEEEELPGKPFLISRDDKATDGLVSQALLVGDLESAVDLCLKDKRMADAIMLSLAGPPELLQKTQRKYFKSLQGGVGELIHAVVRGDWERVVQNCEISCWKEVLAGLVTYADMSQFCSLCEQLGQRLETEKNGVYSSHAIPCYICAGNLNRVVESWMKHKGMGSQPNHLQDIIERIMILKKSLELNGNPVVIESGPMAEKLQQYAMLLAGQGRLEIALHYLGDSSEASIAAVRDRLTHALGYTQTRQTAQPTSRFGSKPYYQPSTAAVPGRTPYYNPCEVNPYAPTTPPVSSAGFSYPSVPTSVPPVSMPTAAPPAPVPPLTPPAAPPTSSSRGPLSRSRIVDPSISSSGMMQPSYTPAAYSFQSPTAYNQVEYESSVTSPYVPTPQPTMLEPQQQQPGIFNPQPPVSTFNPASVPVQQPQQQDISPPQQPQTCWNDPPPFIPKAKPKTEYDPSTAASLPPGLLNPAAMQPTQPQTVPQMPPQQPIQQYQFNQMNGMSELPQTAPVEKPAPAPPPPKQELPAELKPLSDKLHDLQRRCAEVANNHLMKKKLEDVARKLEVLDDKFRGQGLSPISLGGVQEMVNFVSSGDYQNALMYHSQVCSSAPFSEISGFMPGLKALFQVAMQLGVYIH